MKQSINAAKGGMLVALTLLTLYLARFIPTNKLTFLVISSVFVPMGILSLNITQGTIIYVASSLLSFILGLNSISILYIFIFGPYGIIKFLIEKIKKPLTEVILKLLYFNAATAILYMFSKELILINISIDIPSIPLVVLLQFLYLIYDYSLTLLIGYIQRRLFKQYNKNKL